MTPRRSERRKLSAVLFGICALFVLLCGRLYYLQVKWSVNERALLDRVSGLVRDGDIEGATKLCDRSPVPRVVNAALTVAGQGTREIQTAVDEEAMEVLPMIEKRLPYLAMAANLSTLLGLLGTIQGLIQSFNSVAGAEPSQKGALLAKGIAVAMNTTAFGLIVAIPCLAAYTFLQGRSNRLVEQVDRAGARMVNLLSKN